MAISCLVTGANGHLGNNLVRILHGKPPAMTRGIIKSYYGTDQSCNISKARRELGYNPGSPYDALKEAIIYLNNHKANNHGN
jgi:nucleoside-diphosphate-sugar epimerase